MGFDAISIVGYTGNVVACFFFLSPIPTFYSIVKKRSTQNFSPVPYVTTLFNCLLWVIYGLPLVTENSLPVITINGAGALVQTIYTAIFFIYATRQGKIRVFIFLMAVLASIGTIAAVSLTVVPHNVRKLEIGSMCLVVNIAMYAAPLSVLKLVIQTRNVNSMPLLICIFIFLNSCVWMAYGVLKKDIFIEIPNGIGMVFGLAQLTLHVIYPNLGPLTDSIQKNDLDAEKGSYNDHKKQEYDTVDTTREDGKKVKV